ncbi:response regulator transcription factor [Peribacillus sp. SCS-155]|uniref:response regulator transcription factor n=1 Tax=Peribacillus sedimenti TaxID=3115297 RepID=UPI003905A44F
MYKILIVEDDCKIRSLIAEYIKKWNFQPLIIESFEDVDQQVLTVKPHMVLLDINLPNFDGFYWCSKIRQHSDVPIMFISSRTQTMDIIMAMNMGGDDFIQKPFSLEVLVAKINAVLRRSLQSQAPERQVLAVGEIHLHIENGKVHFREKEATLTKNEFHILYLLMNKAGHIISRDEIMRALWENEEFVDDNTLTVNVTRLRKKLESIGIENAIVTRKRQGYACCNDHTSLFEGRKANTLDVCIYSYIH